MEAQARAEGRRRLSRARRLMTVTCPERAEVHLAWEEGTQLRAATLCGLTPVAVQAAGAFLTLGCGDCAAMAADTGLHVACDDDGAAVNVDAFRRRSRQGG